MTNMEIGKGLKRKSPDTDINDASGNKRPKHKMTVSQLQDMANYIKNVKKKKKKPLNQGTYNKKELESTVCTDKASSNACISTVKSTQDKKPGDIKSAGENVSPSKNRKKKKKKQKLQTDGHGDKKENDKRSLNVPKESKGGRKAEKKNAWKKKQRLLKEERKLKKGKTKKEKSDIIDEGPVIIPQKPEEISKNWDTLKTMLDKSKPNKKKNKKPDKMSYSKLKEKKLTEKKSASSEVKAPDIWFDDVDDIFIETKSSVLSGDISSRTEQKHKKDPLVKQGSFSGLTKAIAMDCEMVGVGSDGKQNMLARVSIVNQTGHCIYDEFLLPQEEVTDYRTHVSGVRREDMDNGMKFSVVCKDVAEILQGRILVGHAIQNDLKVLYLSHPKKSIRDTSRYKPFKQLFDGKTPSLKKLTAKVLNVSVQEGEHSSVQDAQAAMRLYTMHKKQWEKALGLNQVRKKKKKNPKQKAPNLSLTLPDDSD